MRDPLFSWLHLVVFAVVFGFVSGAVVGYVQPEPEQSDVPLGIGSKLIEDYVPVVQFNNGLYSALDIATDGKVGAASSSPNFDLSVDTAGATSTIGGGYFCAYFSDESGSKVWITLDPTGAAVFATSSSACNS